MFSLCLFRQPDDGYTLAETCSWFCTINKLCLDLIYLTSDFADSTTDVNCLKIPPLYQSAIPCLYT